MLYSELINNPLRKTEKSQHQKTDYAKNKTELFLRRFDKNKEAASEINCQSSSMITAIDSTQNVLKIATSVRSPGLEPCMIIPIRSLQHWNCLCCSNPQAECVDRRGALFCGTTQQEQS